MSYTGNVVKEGWSASHLISSSEPHQNDVIRFRAMHLEREKDLPSIVLPHKSISKYCSIASSTNRRWDGGSWARLEMRKEGNLPITRRKNAWHMRPVNKIDNHIFIKKSLHIDILTRKYGGNHFKWNDSRLLYSGISISKKEQRRKLFRFYLVTTVDNQIFL